MKSKFCWGSAILCCLMAFCFVACSDDDDDNVFTIDDTLKTDGITTDEDGGIFEIAVNGNSEWSVNAPDKWVNIIVGKGKGNSKAVILVEAKYDGISRNSTLTFKVGDKNINIPVKQIVNKQNVVNDLSSSKGLGFAYNVKKFEKGTIQLFNLEAIRSVKEAFGPRYANIIIEGARSELKAEDAICDSLVDKSDTLKVALSCNISYGAFKFGISGQLDSHEKQFSSTKQINMASNYPKYEGVINTSVILSAYNDWKNNDTKGLLEGQYDCRGWMINSDLLGYLEELTEVANESDAASYKDDIDIEDICSDIESLAGPVFVAKAIVGGSYMLQCDFDSVWTEQSFAIKDGKVTAELKAGLFSLDAEVKVSYANQMTETLEHANYKALFKGGDMQTAQGIWTAFRKLERTSAASKEYNDSINKWVGTFNLGDENVKNSGNCELIEVDLEGPWNLLDRRARKAKRYLMNYIADKYKDNDVVMKLNGLENARSKDDK